MNEFLNRFIDDDEDEDDVIPLDGPLRSYVESNEEMTESDCNVQEDDERTGINLVSVLKDILFFETLIRYAFSIFHKIS